MDESSSCQLPSCVALVNSDEPLWEWDVASDALHMSQGARQALGLETAPLSMTAFLRLLSPEAARELVQARGRALAGRHGMECTFFWPGDARTCLVRERLVVLTRNCEGHATRVLAALSFRELPGDTDRDAADVVASGPVAADPVASGLSGVDIGVWFYAIPARRIWRDATFLALVGREDKGGQPVDLACALADVHPSERAALNRHYRLMLENARAGDRITDIVRMRQPDGGYAPMLLRASVLERDEAGHPRLMGGIVSGTEYSLPGAEALAQDERLFQAFNALGSGQWNWDTHTDLVFFCPRYRAMLGDPEGKGMDTVEQWRSRIHPDDYNKVREVQQAAITSPARGDIFECTYRMRHANGSWVWLFDRCCVTWRDASGRAGHLVGSITDITTAQAERDRLEDLVRRDTLTGLRSRAYCNLEIEQLERNRIRPVSVIAGDVTGLKMINDNLGHALGDSLLTRAATLLHGSLRQSDCVARMGGDEFLVLLPLCPRARGEKVLAKIEARFAAHNSAPDHFPVHAAFGLATAQSAEEPLSRTIARADAAMLERKAMQRKAAHADIKRWIRNATGADVGEDERLADE